MMLGILLLLIPFAFAVLRLQATGNDYRYLVVAVASSIGALLMLGRSRVTSVARLLVAVAVAALCAAIAAALVGSRNATSVAVVSLGFAMCSATGVFVYTRSRAAKLP